MTMVRHARKRAAVRYIPTREIEAVFEKGKRIPTYLDREMAMLNGLILIIDVATQVVITCYDGTPCQLKAWE